MSKNIPTTQYLDFENANIAPRDSSAPAVETDFRMYEMPERIVLQNAHIVTDELSHGVAIDITLKSVELNCFWSYDASSNTYTYFTETYTANEVGKLTVSCIYYPSDNILSVYTDLKILESEE